jgi:NADH-quinone oxidoreductase subunit C
MADEPKVPPAGGASETPARPAPAAGTPAAPPAKPAAPAAKPAAPAAPKAPVKPDPWSSPLLNEVQKRFPNAVSEAVVFRNMPSITVAKESLVAMCEFLRSEEGGGYTLLTDHTAVDYPKREKRFDLIYHLYSFKRNDRLRVKVVTGESEKVPSVVAVWPTANWLEREVYDLFGVAYEGHPDLKRILMPDDWVGHPLRKDYDILKQDETWVQANLGIKSAQ